MMTFFVFVFNTRTMRKFNSIQFNFQFKIGEQALGLSMSKPNIIYDF